MTVYEIRQRDLVGKRHFVSQFYPVAARALDEARAMWNGMTCSERASRRLDVIVWRSDAPYVETMDRIAEIKEHCASDVVYSFVAVSKSHLDRRPKKCSVR